MNDKVAKVAVIHEAEASELAQRLKPPDPPLPLTRDNSAVLILVTGIGILILGICLFVGFSTGETAAPAVANKIPPAIVSALKFGSVPSVFGIGFIVLGYFLRKKSQERIRIEQAELTIECQRWQKARSRWEKLYYCERDDIVFVPGEMTSASVANMNTYLYQEIG